MEKELDALRRVDFNWTFHLQGVWEDHPYHVEGLQPRIAAEFSSKLQQLKHQKSTRSPLGWVLTGVGGSGKTHLLSRMRAEAVRQDCVFILVDMTDIHDFWGTVAIGYTSSLQEPYSEELSQSQFILRQLISTISSPDKIGDNMRVIVQANPNKLKSYSEQILQAIARKNRQMTMEHQDTIRALIASNSEDFELSNLGQLWLQGIELDQADKGRLGFRTDQRHSRHTVVGLSWIISLSTPSVVAFDQLDPIVRQLEFEAIQSARSGNDIQEAVANSIISGIGDGLRAMYDSTQRTLVVLSCLESSWDILQQRVLQSSSDRFTSPSTMELPRHAERFEQLVAARIAPACREVGMEPPFPTWPFHKDAFADLSGVTPRELLKRCYRHQQLCLETGTINILGRFEDPANCQKRCDAADRFASLDAKFDQYRKAADVATLLDENNEDGELASVIVSACEVLLLEVQLPESIHAIVDTQFTGGSNVKPLHARIRLVMHDEEEREEHFSVRALQRTNAVAFQNRLKLVMTQSGIDLRLSFRHTAILRTTPLPGGKKTEQFLAEFMRQGGCLYAPSDDELRSLWALHRLSKEVHAEFEAWVRNRGPLMQMAWCKELFAGVVKYAVSKPEVAPANQKQTAPAADAGEVMPPDVTGSADHVPNATTQPHVLKRDEVQATPVRQTTSSTHSNLDDSQLPLGRRLIGKNIAQPLTIPVSILDKHVVVRAGSGSGKTVLLKRIIEEAALREIPSIVIDSGNDMSALGDRWPSVPEGWQDSDSELAERYHSRTETVIWTPGRRTSNPLRLELIPDIRATVNAPDEFEGAVAMVSEGIADVLSLKSSRNDQNKQAILLRSLRFFVEQGLTGLETFIELLSDLPGEARIGIKREDALASELADDLRVLREKDPLIGDEEGEPLDPAILFGDDQYRDRTRVSVINLSFLPSDTERLRFVNRLATSLFAWIKANPNPPGRELRGLLVLDEAKDMIPSQRNTPCKQSIARLAAQARKYKLGLIFATQNPREIENTVVGNCSTQFFGKCNSTTAIDTVRDLIAQLRGNAQDIGRLERGVFYTYNAEIGMDAPVKVTVPMCLSHHRPLTTEEVLNRTRPRMASIPG